MSDHHIRGRDIVVVGLQPWDIDLGSNCKNLAMEFSTHNRVLYVNSPLDRRTLLTNSQDPKIKKRLKIIKGGASALNEVAPNIWELYPDRIVESINWISIPWLYDALNKRNNRIFSSCIEKAIQNLGFRDIILFNDNDFFRSYYMKDFLNPAVSVYYCRDFLLAVDYFKRHGKRLESKLIAKSDICVANSVFLANYCRRYNDKSFYVGQGCDIGLFKYPITLPVPRPMESINGPVIGYVGALHSVRLDLDVIEHIALSRPDWAVVLVGPEDETFRGSKLHSISNVHFIGAQDMSVLPAYINTFDVCINPQAVNPLTEGNYPRKVDEYLAMGKPVVATATEAMQTFADYSYLAITREDYINYIQKALDEDNADLRLQRRAFASSHTWENSAEQIYKAINSASLRSTNEETSS